MSDLPSEVFREILLRLPADSLFRFRAVCKEWCHLIDDASFIKSHTHNQLSSNTLLIRNSTGAPLYLISLESLDFTDDERQSIVAIPVKQLIRRGVPRLGDLPKASCNGLILISSNDIKKTWAIWNPLTRACHELHWASRDRIIAFHLATEEYRHLPLPSRKCRSQPSMIYLDVLGGCLILTYYDHMLAKLYGWVMNDYGVAWKKLFLLKKCDFVGYLDRVRPVAYLKAKRQVILQQERGFYLFNVEDGSVKEVSIHGLSGISSVPNCPGSLVQLGDGCCVAPKKTTGVKRKRVVKKKRAEIRLTFCVRR